MSKDPICITKAIATTSEKQVCLQVLRDLDFSIYVTKGERMDIVVKGPAGVYTLQYVIDPLQTYQCGYNIGFDCTLEMTNDKKMVMLFPVAILTKT